MATDGERGGRLNRRSLLQKMAGASAAGLLAAGASEPVAAGKGSLGGSDGNPCDWSRGDDANLPWDTGGAYGGWGGHEYHGTSAGQVYNPIIFVHGNGRDACDWEGHAEYMIDQGYYGDELWAITFVGTSDDADTPTHEDMRDQLDDFVQHVMDYTGANQVDVVEHSLGVTGAYWWMDSYDRYDWVNTYVGLAGAFNGNCWCSCCCDQGDEAEPCQFIAAQCYYDGHPLYDMQQPDETPSGTNWYTVRGYYDGIYNPCGLYYSSYLDGADNNLYYTDHDGVRTNSKGDVFDWTYYNN